MPCHSVYEMCQEYRVEGHHFVVAPINNLGCEVGIFRASHAHVVGGKAVSYSEAVSAASEHVLWRDLSSEMVDA